tara:strand:- start:5971 stop:9723 length:3753 start_codon:yes stop_codon:yes gene_type:complete
MLHLLLSVPLLCPTPIAAPLAPSPTAVVQDVLDDGIRQAAMIECVNGSPHQGVFSLARSVLHGIEMLRNGGTEDALALADEIEFLLIVGMQIGGELDHEDLWVRFYSTVDVPPQYGALRSRLAWMKRDMDTLQPLLDWQFAGPFDNERGRGMTRRTAAEKDPLAETYEGKVRPVGWRTLPEATPRLGIVRFQRLLHPIDQACVVARTWVQSEDAQRVHLQLGISGEMRVWLNGEPIAEALGEHALAPDQFCMPLDLVPGWNEITMKVGAQEGTPGFVARLSDPANGAPLSLPTASQAPEGVEPISPKNPGRSMDASKLELRPGAMQRFHVQDDPASLLRRAMLVVDARAKPRKAQPGLVESSMAVEANPDDLLATLLHLDSLRVQGALSTEEDVNPWLHALDDAILRHGPKAQFLRWKSVHATTSQPTPHRALELIDQALRSNPNAVLCRLRRAQILAELGQGALADNELMRLAENEDITRYWAGVSYALHTLKALGSDERMEFLQAASSGVRAARRELAAVARRRDRDRSTARILADLQMDLDQDPWDIEMRISAARILIATEDFGAAQELIDTALAFNPEDPYLHAIDARAALARGDHERAILSLERELEFDFNAEDDRRLLEHLLDSGVPPFHDAWDVSLDEILESRSGDSLLPANIASREVLLNQLVVEVHPDGTAKRYRRRVVRLLNDAGVRELDRRRFRAYPRDEEVRVLAASVRSPDGTVEQARTGRTGMRGFLEVDLPPLQVGDIVDMSWRRDDLRPTFFGTYFGLDEPIAPDPRTVVRHTDIVLIAPREVELHLHNRGVAAEDYRRDTLTDGRVQHRWNVYDQFPERSEQLEPPAIETNARVQASTYGSWEEFGRWWWGLIAEEIRTSPEMEAEVARLTDGLTAPADKLRAIYDFVVSDIRYNAWEFGVHGYQPYSAPVVFSRRFGDCKDKAILLKAMLSVVDIEAWPVIIRAEGRRFEEDISLALVSHFNHCIAYVPAQEGIDEMYLDGTARFHPLEVLPDSDRGARVVIVRDDGVQEARVPFATAEQNVLVDHVTVQLSADGGGDVTVERRPTGRWDPRERSNFAGDDDERLETLRGYLSSRFGSLVGEPSAEHSDYEDLTLPFEIRMNGRFERIAERREGRLELPTTFDATDLLGRVASESERTSDLLLDVAWTRESVVDYRLPEGASLQELPAPVHAETPDALYTRTVASTDGGARVTERLVMRTHRVPPDRYAAFRELARTVADAQRTRIAVEVQR